MWYVMCSDAFLSMKVVSGDYVEKLLDRYIFLKIDRNQHIDFIEELNSYHI